MKVFKNTRNPILPWNEHMPDPEAHVMPDGNLYIYGSYDDNKDTYCSEKYHVVSTPDMENWTIHDIAFEGKNVPWFYDSSIQKYPGIDWSNPTPFLKKQHIDCPVILEDEREVEDVSPQTTEETRNPAFLYAPDAIYKEGKYYLYFCMSDDSEGVAVSDKPEGPFSAPVRLSCGGIDPAIFIDTDGQAYYYWGQLSARGVRLNSDMVSFDEKEIVTNLITEEEHFFHEGSSVRKIKDTYYMVYSNMERGRPTSLGYATSKSPLGPFTYRGIIIDNVECDPVSWNNHGSIEEFHGQWYIFYHRSSHCTRMYRRLCIEPITINPDGTINEVKMTSQGVGEPFQAGEEIYGYQACGLSGSIFIGDNRQDGEWLTNISENDEAIFRYVQTDCGFQSILLKAEGHGKVEVYLEDAYDGFVDVEGRGEYRAILSACPRGTMELKLKFKAPTRLKVTSVTLFE